MTESRCPSCGASNPASAAWCGQCYAKLGGAPAAGTAEDAATPADADEQMVRPDVGAAVEDPAQHRSMWAAPPTEAVREGFRRRADGQLEWACASCGEFNDFDAFECRVCGASFGQRYEEPRAEDPVNWPLAFALSAVAPGVGHVVVRRHGSGLARLLLFLVWLLGGVVTLAAGGAPAAAPLLLGAMVLWAGSILDLVRLRDGQAELLGGRTLLWLVVGVIGLSLVGLFTAALTAQR